MDKEIFLSVDIEEKKDLGENKIAVSVEKVNKNECTGCGCCRNLCPVEAIEMKADEDGFLYPEINQEKCTSCGLCYNKCPSIKQVKRGSDTPECYAVMASDDIRMKSSSGGMFTLLAEHIIDNGGFICGAAYSNDYMKVDFIIVSDKEELAKLRGFKYVQSDTGTTYTQIKELLEKGKEVLFSGCPCQVAGLKNYLGKEYDSLLTVDLVCHASSSPEAYHSFLKECAAGKEIESVNFCEKEVYGWSTSLTVKYTDGSMTRQPHDKCDWYNGILGGIINRPYCGHCEYANSHRVGDITLGDFWGIGSYKAEWDDRKGTSLVMINTEKGKKAFKRVRSRMILCEKAPLEHAQKFNEQLVHPMKLHPGRRFFFHHLPKDGYGKSLLYGRKYRYDVGLVGWWFASNYGSALTYYALGKILEDMDMLAIMVQIPKLNKTPWEPQTKKTIDFIQKFFPITKSRTIEQMPDCNHFCDMFMLGSDQLWTKGTIDLTGYTFFLDFVNAGKKKIAFATSFGHEKFSGTDEQKIFAGLNLQKFDYISVRETSGIVACKENFGLEVQRDLDPVFICDRRHYDALAEASSSTDEDYLLCYILDPTEEKQMAIKYASEKLGLKIIALLDMKTEEVKKQEWHTGELRENPSIEDFVYYVKHCKFLITDSHHGVCFGIIYQKNFISFANYSRGIVRFTSLLELFGLSERLLHDPRKLSENANLFTDIDYESVYAVLEREKEMSLKHLKIALTKPKREDIDNSYSVNLLQNEINKLHTNPDFIKIRMLATLLRDYGVKHIVLSPGGRDVPLVRMFEYNEGSFIIHRVTDERSAAYFGLGIATQLQQPVVCVCTSGTAASNYLPAVTEAYYTGIPLIVITADRQSVYHEHGEDQTIPQQHIYDGVVKKSITVPEGSGYHVEYQTRRDISDCILEATHNGFGPTHINIAIDNISIGAKVPREAWKLLPRINPHILRVGFNDGEKKLMEWVNELKKSKRILVVYGQNAPLTDQQKQHVENFAKKYNCVIVTDHISNLNCAYTIQPYNMLRAISGAEFNEKLSPDILISVGGKRLMNDPLTYKIRGGLKNIRNWSVAPDGRVKDFYFRLTSVIEMSQDKFFDWFSSNAGESVNDGIYYESWRQLSSAYGISEITKFDSHFIQSRFFPSLPGNSMLHLGVGQSFFDCRRYTIDKTVEIYCNMGTNGIDGCTSTFLGQCAVAKDKLCFLIVGDLSFFYDMNSIWNKELSNNIRILMVNNNGTGLLRGHNLKAISSVHNTSAKGWVESTGFKYMSASTKEEYEEKLGYFLQKESDGPLFFEVFCE